jgi:hypothetical protein
MYIYIYFYIMIENFSEVKYEIDESKNMTIYANVPDHLVIREISKQGYGIFTTRQLKTGENICRIKSLYCELEFNDNVNLNERVLSGLRVSPSPKVRGSEIEVAPVEDNLAKFSIISSFAFKLWQL